jgi:argininosuccinate lyase
MMMTTNLPSGYHRDLQLLKEHLFPAFGTLKDCLQMAGLMLSNIEIRRDILKDEKYQYLFSVEEVNKLVLAGVPFRDAYKQVGLAIENNQYQYSTEVNHTHEGSIGRLCTAEIRESMQQVLSGFNFSQTNAAVEELFR